MTLFTLNTIRGFFFFNILLYNMKGVQNLRLTADSIHHNERISYNNDTNTKY